MNPESGSETGSGTLSFTGTGAYKVEAESKQKTDTVIGTLTRKITVTGGESVSILLI